MLHSLMLKCFESFHRRRHCSTLQSLYTALDHQLQDGLVAQDEFDRMRYVVRKLFDLKYQLYAIEAEPSLPLPADDIEHTIALRVYFQDRYSSVCIPICCSNWGTTTNEHLYKVVNYVNCVNMYI